MKMMVYPGYPLKGELTLPGDKSMSHRAALLAAMADGESIIENFLVAGVTQAMLEALSALGVEWQLQGTTLRIQGVGLHGFKPPALPLNCGNSATTLRLLAGGLAAAGVEARLDGSPGLQRRPMQRIVTPLQAMGVLIEASPGGVAPLRLQARPAGQMLKALDYVLPVASAQLKSCLLLAALAADGPTRLIEPAPSRDHTENMLKSMGVDVQGTSHPNQVVITPPQDGRLSPIHTTLPGDFSSAAFLIIAALVTPGSDLVLKSVGLNPTRLGLLDILVRMGGDVKFKVLTMRNNEFSGSIWVKFSYLHAAEVSGAQVVRMIDEFPAFASAAAFAQGVTVVKDAAELRNKESDRIASLCLELTKLGFQARETPGGFEIQGGMPQGAVLETHGDHRLGMALGLTGLAAREPVIITGAEIISESFPGFVDCLQSLGARIELEDTSTEESAVNSNRPSGGDKHNNG